MMARERVRAAARKLEARARHDEARQIAAGVYGVAVLIRDEVPLGSLWFTAPCQFVAEQMAVRLADRHDIAGERVDDLAAYTLSGLQEYVVAFAGDFDMQHFEAWSAAEAPAAE